jgi:hypothetical protein
MRNYVKLFEQYQYDESSWGELGVSGLEEILRTVYSVEIVKPKNYFQEFEEDDYLVSLDLIDVTKISDGRATSLAMVFGGDDEFKVRVYDRDTCAITFSDGHPVVYVEFENLKRNEGMGSIYLRIAGLGPMDPDVVSDLAKWPPGRRFLLDIIDRPYEYDLNGLEDIKRVLGDLSWIEPEKVRRIMRKRGMGGMFSKDD